MTEELFQVEALLKEIIPVHILERLGFELTESEGSSATTVNNFHRAGNTNPYIDKI